MSYSTCPTCEQARPCACADAPVRHLYCSCCGASTLGRQWHNMDTGHGLCERCADWIAARNRPEDDIPRTYGVRGYHFAIAGDARP